ncbi:NADH-dependent flavin oxidoreductase, partial [Coemansia sp. RSA 2531]
MSPAIIKSQDFYQSQANPSPGTAIEPPAAAIAQGFAQGPNPNPLPKAFQPLTIRNYTIKNRIWVSPMCTYSSDDGYATDFHLAHYSQYAMRGAGLIVVEATGVLPEGRITPNCL